MHAKDVMTTNVVTVTPETKVEDIAHVLIENHVSAVPVVDSTGTVVGIVSEGDLVHRPEIEPKRRRSWWLAWFSSSAEGAQDYTKSHGTTAEELMTPNVVTVSEDTEVSEIARILEVNHIKRVPVLRDGKLVGIVSRANLLHALVARREAVAATPSIDDRSIRDKVLSEIVEQGWVTHGGLNVIVNDGVVELWGTVDSEEERKALIVAAENVVGVKQVVDHLGMIPPYLREA
jgi:CBS domain-containing protein